MKSIKLTQSREVMVDDDDFEKFASLKWHTCAGYPARRDTATGKVVYMHRLIMQPQNGYCVDHIDGNPLNNQRANLRLCTHQQNLMAKRKKTKGSSRFRGVTWDKKEGRWMAQIMKAGRNKFLGYFSSDSDAAVAYNSAAKHLFGEFASVNVVE